MKKDIIFSLSSPYRDDFRVTGYRFGKGEKSCCIIGSLRGNEIQQLYMCSQLVKTLEALERKGDIAYDREILIIPSINSYGTNIGKRFWCLDNTDINRMFPGDPDGPRNASRQVSLRRYASISTACSLRASIFRECSFRTSA